MDYNPSNLQSFNQENVIILQSPVLYFSKSWQILGERH